jgi:ABC-2 type transport system ATP-binding protein
VLAESGTTVVLSSHVIADVEDACDHLVLLGGGRVRLDGAVDDLLAQHRIVTGAIEPDRTVVHSSRSGRQGDALVRGTGHGELPTLDDLVMGYLQAEDGQVAAAGAPS